MSSRDFSKLALRVRRRQIITVCVIVIIAVIVSMGLLSYKIAGTQLKPPVTLHTVMEGDENGSVTTYTSIGFKQLVYASDYGCNYSERIPFWEKADNKADYLTGTQYESLMKLMQKELGSNRKKCDFIDSFSDFEANIFYVEKKDDEYLIYLGGKSVTYYKVDEEIYDNIDGNPAISGDAGVGWKAYAVSAEWNGNAFKNEKLLEYQLGKKGAEKIFEEIPKPVAMMMTGGAAGEINTADVIEERSLLKACAHYGAMPSVDKRIGYVIEKNAVEVYNLDSLYEDGEVIEDTPIKVIRAGDR